MPEGQPVTLEQLRALVQPILAEAAGVTPLRGLKGGPARNANAHQVYFTARCTCGTAAVLSVEVARSKALAEVREALPALTERLRSQAQTFFSMSCELHRGMQVGRRAALPKAAVGQAPPQEHPHAEA